jgi:membrane protein implicated in regulation of membrane protease activity
MIVGVILGIGDMLHLDMDTDGDGPSDLGLDHDVDHGVEHVTGHHDHDSTNTIFALLGFGKAPMLILLMAMSLIFGGVGIVVNLFIAPLLKITGIFVFISFIIAFIAMVSFTGIIARIVSRLMPTLETKSVTGYNLIGSEGSIIMNVGPTFSGVVQITKDGDVYQVPCRCNETLSIGTRVIVTKFDGQALLGMYDVCRDPLKNGY